MTYTIEQVLNLSGIYSQNLHTKLYLTILLLYTLIISVRYKLIQGFPHIYLLFWLYFVQNNELQQLLN